MDLTRTSIGARVGALGAKTQPQIDNWDEDGEEEVDEVEVAV
tara:strand:- start:459 stop:584 length:126 start_codon:yes stop_codon:yes gene_type:complete